jgi:glycosyltransferase involved in cell wall biosynthesis
MTARHLELLGHQVKVLHPQLFYSVPCPTYPEIRLALARRSRIERELREFSPHAVHIATEGPLGWAARSVCRKEDFPFTTSYHTRFPEYIRMRMPVPLTFSYPFVRNFHAAATRVMVATPALKEELEQRNFQNLVHWSRGVDTDLFRPDAKSTLCLEQPVLIYVGRVAVEKNLEAFLQLNLPGSKVIVGDGPARKELEKNYPEVHFAGYRQGEELAGYIAAANVFVFPSLTDTFGIVLLEAMACGVPVAAFPVTGPINIVRNGVNGWLDTDLDRAISKAMEVEPESCRNSALKYSWASCSKQFFTNLEIMPRPFA